MNCKTNQSSEVTVKYDDSFTPVFAPGFHTHMEPISPELFAQPNLEYETREMMRTGMNLDN